MVWFSRCHNAQPHLSSWPDWFLASARRQCGKLTIGNALHLWFHPRQAKRPLTMMECKCSSWVLCAMHAQISLGTFAADTWRRSSSRKGTAVCPKTARAPKTFTMRSQSVVPTRTCFFIMTLNGQRILVRSSVPSDAIRASSGVFIDERARL